MDVIFSASIIASFLAGMVALFAPCCITVLLPAYLASAFREKKNIVKMTLIFFGGIAVVLIPIGLGAAWLAEIFRDFHKEMYIIGGAFMVVLAVLAVLGKGISLPGAKRLKTGGNAKDPKSVFLLGILSGAATSCCAPVLAGVMTLAVISGSFIKALIVTFVYVFGMVFPLFIAAYFYDRFKIEQSRFIQGKLFTVQVKTKTFYIHSTNIVAAALFLLIGGTMLTLGFSNNAFYSPHTQAELGRTLNVWATKATEVLTVIPDIVWGILILGLFAFFLFRARKSSNKKLKQEIGNNDKPTCH
jgi:cytochrome c-type biogenesis protein